MQNFTLNLFKLFLISIVLLLPGASVSASDPLDDILSKLAAQPALSGEFTQATRSGISGLVENESGTCLLARGGRARFDYKLPEGKVALSDGLHFLLYVPRDKQLIRQAMRADAAPALLLRGAAVLRKNFQITTAQIPPSDGGGWRLELRPEDKDAAWDRIEVEINPAGLPARILFHDATGGTTDLRLTLKPAPAPADALFAFIPPPGTELLSEGEDEGR